METKRPMSVDTFESLVRVIQYLDDELRHYEQSGKPDNHIAADVLRLKKWTEKESGVPLED